MGTAVRTLVATLLIGGANWAGAGSAMAESATPAGVNVTGPWTGTWAYQHQDQGAGTVIATFEQSGEKLSGSLTLYGTVGREYTVVGFVDGNQIKLSQPTLGAVTINGDEMSGILDGWDNARISLRRQ